MQTTVVLNPYHSANITLPAANSDKTLCDRCESHFQIFNNNSVRESAGPVTVTALKASQSAGCYICSALLTVDLTRQFEPWPNDPHETLHERWHFFESRCELRLSIERPNPPLRNRIAHKRIDLRPLQSRPGLIPPTIPAPNVSESSWVLIVAT